MRSKAFVAALLLGLLACSALAGPGPRVDQPKEGDVLGPDYVISGSTGQKALVVVLTDVILSDTGRVYGTVPGIRHYSKDDGSFQFRCASPRVPMGSRQADVIYRIRCFVMAPGGKAGPETVVTLARCAVELRRAAV